MPAAPPDQGLIPAINPQGQLVHLEPGQWTDAVAQGYRQPTPQEWQASFEHQKYGGTTGQIQAGAMGAAQAIPIVGEPLAATVMGLTPEEALKVREENPITHGVASIASTVAGPTGKLIGKAGEKVAGAVAGKVGTGLAGRLAPGVARAATETALFQANDVSSRVLLGDPNLTAEKAVAEVGIAGVLGGAGAGAIGLTGEGLGSLLSKGQDLAKRAASKVASGADKETLKIVLSDEMRPTVIALDKSAPGAADALSVARPETAKFLLDNAQRVHGVEAQHPGILKDVLAKATPDEAKFILENASGIISGTVERNQIGQVLTDQVTQTFQGTEKAVRAAWKGARSAEMEALAGKADPVAVSQQAGSVFDGLLAKVEELKRAPELYTPGTGTRLERLVEGLQRDITADPAQTYARLNRVKQSLDDLIPWGQEASTAAGRDTAALLKDVRGQVRSALEDTKVWGEAGARQREFNKAFQEYRDAAKRIGAGKGNGLEARILRKIDDGAGGVTYEANEKTVNAWLNAMADARGGAKSGAFNAFLDKSEALAGQLEKSGHEGATELGDAIRKMRSDFAVTEQRATVNQIVNRLQNPGKILVSEGYIPSAGQIAKDAGAALAGSVLPGSGVISRTATATVEKLRSPSFMVGALNALEKLTGSASRAIESGVSRVFGVGAEAAAAQAGGAAADRLTSKTFEKVASTLRDYEGNPEKLATDVSGHTSLIADHSPDHAAALSGVAGRAVSFLASKLPDTSPMGPLDAKRAPSSDEIARFGRYYSIAQKPASILDHVAKGTLTPEHVEAAATIYPRLLDEMKQQAMSELAKAVAKGNRAPYRTRLSLAMFLGEPLNASMSPQSMQANQAAMAAPPSPQSPPSSGSQALNLSNRMQTPMQASGVRAA